jgi:hypothetical protein
VQFLAMLWKIPEILTKRDHYTIKAKLATFSRKKKRNWQQFVIHQKGKVKAKVN